MSEQKTINNPFSRIGRCMYSGNVMEAKFYPLEANEGIWFGTPEGRVKATLENAVPCRRSLMLKDPESGAEIINVEHVLATLYAFGVDNLYIDVRRLRASEHAKAGYDSYKSSIAYHTYRAFKDMGYNVPMVFPNLREEESTLCAVLNADGLRELKAEKKVIRLDEPFVRDKLSFHPVPNSNCLMMTATTDYPVIGRQRHECKINPKTYTEQIAKARRYAHYMQIMVKIFGEEIASPLSRFIANFAFYSFGIGHGCHPGNVFVPKKRKKDWSGHEYYPAEIARHSIMDRLGAIALLGARLEGVWCEMEFSNHENDVLVLREFMKEYAEKKHAV